MSFSYFLCILEWYWSPLICELFSNWSCISDQLCSVTDADANTLDQMEKLDLLWKLRKEVIRLVKIKDKLEAKQVDGGQGSRKNETCIKKEVENNSRIISTSSREESKTDKADVTLDVRVNLEEKHIENVLG